MNKILRFTKENLPAVFLVLLFSTIALSIKKTFITSFSYSTGEYSNFLTYFLYLSDFLALGIIFLALAKKSKEIPKNKAFLIPLIIFILFFLANISHLIVFNLFFFGKILEFYLLGWSVLVLWREEYKKILFAFIIFALFETIICILQFSAQHSLGLKLIGESLLNPDMSGVAKILLHGKRLIRPYGTFPHPNPLSAFLIFALFITILFKTSSKKLFNTIFLEICLFLLTLGVFLTFSRAGLIALAIGLLSYVILLVIKKSLSKQSTVPIISIIFAAILSFAILRPYLTTRETLSDQGVQLRALYNRTGLNMLKSRPFQGFGPGTSMLHMEQYTPRSLKSWEIQPIHNYYLLVLVELGVVGGLSLLYVIVSPALKLIKKFIKEPIILQDRLYYRAILISIFISFSILMLFDHYFYTLQQTQLLLWILVGLMGAEIKNEA